MANVKDDDRETLEFADESEWADGHSYPELTEPTTIWDSSDVFDDIAEMIADWFGRSVIDPDRELARQIVDRVRRN